MAHRSLLRRTLTLTAGLATAVVTLAAGAVAAVAASDAAAVRDDDRTGGADTRSAQRTGEPSIYRTTGPDGRPVFTDRPGSAPAERVELSPRNTFDPADPAELPVTRLSPDGDDEDGSSEDAPVYEVTIESPGDAETIRENAGNLTVTSRVEPELADGDRLQLLLDGAPAGTSRNGVFELQAVDRGEHHLKVQVIDERGRVHAASATHRIQLLRHSILNR